MLKSLQAKIIASIVVAAVAVSGVTAAVVLTNQNAEETSAGVLEGSTLDVSDVGNTGGTEPSLETATQPTEEPEATAEPETETPEPTVEPTAAPTAEPTPVPTPEPTAVPTPEPTPVPTPEPTPVPTPEPTPVPTPVPTPEPTPDPTPEPMPEPTPDSSTSVSLKASDYPVDELIQMDGWSFIVSSDWHRPSGAKGIGVHLNDGSAKWLWLNLEDYSRKDEVNAVMAQFTIANQCNCNEITHGGTKPIWDNERKVYYFP